MPGLHHPHNENPERPTRAAGSLGRRWRRFRLWLIPLFVLVCVTLPGINSGDWRGDQAWYTAIGLQAWRDGALWSLRAEPGQFFFNKPPLVFWIHGAAAHLLGPSLWAARMPSVVAAGGCVLAVVALARRFGSRQTAMAAGVVLALTYEFFRRTHEVSLDLWLVLMMLLALLIAGDCAATGRYRRLPWLGVPLGLALLCKPVVALLLLPILAGWFMWNRQRGWFVPLLMAGFVSLLIAGPWHVSIWLMHGSVFTDAYFGSQIIERAAGHARDMNRGSESVFYYPTLFARTYWPWMIPLALALVSWARGLELTRDRRGLRLALLWVATWGIALLLFPDRRPRYAVVLYPGLAWLTGMWLARQPWRWLARSYRPLGRFGPPLLAAGAIVIAVSPIRLHGPPNPQWADLDAWLDGHGDPVLWQGALDPGRGARLYLTRGRWPMTTRDRTKAVVAEPPAGALLIYHRRDGLTPGDNEQVVFQSGDLRVTRLGTGGGSGGGSPISISDPGESSTQ
jgi:4-amino-4-deoxy-L-arabinose transferase-like glycosyltransferase